MIAIIDYGGGNIGSVKNALDYLRLQSVVTDDPGMIRKVDRIILPGQGRFGDVMKRLREKNLDKVILEEISKNKPFLGICIGLQVLFESSDEDPQAEGLGILKGKCCRFSSDLKVPQIGWNRIRMTNRSRLLKEVRANFFYFVHSFYAIPEKKGIITATSEYGQDFPAVVEAGNIFATQFHPEKSGISGLRILKNFGEIRC